MLFLNYNGGIDPMYLQTPEVTIPFDPNYFPDNADSGKYALKISLTNLEENESMRELHSKLTELDDFLMNAAVTNSGSWLKKPKISLETIKELYTPLLKVHTDQETGEPTGKWPDQFGFKVVMKNKKFPGLSIYDKNKTNFDINNETDNPVDIKNILVKGASIKAVLKCNGLWIANGKFGCTWRAQQIRVKVPEGGLKEFAILSDSDDSDNEEEEQKEQSSTPLAENVIEDSSDEEQEPVKEKKTVKKKVKVKKTN